MPAESFFEEPFGEVDLVIDHQPEETTARARLKDIRPAYGATSTILTEYLRAADVKITQRLATALLYGINTDTRHLERGATRADMEAFTFLHAHANHSALRRIERPELSDAALDVLAAGIARRRVVAGVVFVHLGAVGYPELVAQFADLFLQVEGVEWAVVSGTIADEVHVSVRNVGYVRAAGDVVRQAFGALGSAGGHRSMAKAVVPLRDWRRHVGEPTDDALAREITTRFVAALHPETDHDKRQDKARQKINRNDPRRQAAPHPRSKSASRPRSGTCRAERLTESIKELLEAAATIVWPTSSPTPTRPTSRRSCASFRSPTRCASSGSCPATRGRPSLRAGRSDAAGARTALDEQEVSRILDHMPSDHVVEVVEELPKERPKDPRPHGRGEVEEVQELLEYGEGTAGRLMSTNLVAVHEGTTVAQAIEHIRKSASGDDAFYLYVIDDHEHLVGLVPLHRLLTADPATPVRLIRDEDVESVRVDTDQEEVARLVQRYNLREVPVVDGGHRLLGTISVDDVIDVIREEATEDIQRLGGAAGDETVLDPPRAVLPTRLIWR